MAHSRLLYVLPIIVLARSVSAQGPPVNIQPRMSMLSKEPAAHLRVDSNLVLVPVMVTDKFDRLVLGLGKERFQVFDDRVEQQISEFAVEDAPISVIVVFDTSGSMGRKLQISRMAVGEFLKASNPEDEFALIEFAERPKIAATFTDNADQVQNRLAFLEARGRTALIDAICVALDQMKHARHARKAILVVSDGGDNSSRFTRGELKRRVREADVQIYAIGITDYSLGSAEEADGPALLSDIAGQTGGRYYAASGLMNLTAIATRIGSALRHQYVLGYSPSPVKADGKYHRIVVKIPQAKGDLKLKASFRTSYLAPPQ